MLLETCIARTESLCPVCLASLPAAYVVSGGGVRLQRDCPEHGRIAPEVWGDAAHFRRFLELFPLSRGADALSVRNAHACVAVLDVTERCNLRCTYCFASSEPGSGETTSFERVVAALDAIVATGGPRPLQLSGGEPTIRHDLPEIVRAARERGFGHVEVNTNGIRLAREKGYARALKEAGAAAVYLQFDGLSPDTHRRIRGLDLGRVKAKAIEACRDARLPVILVATVVAGVNDSELGAIVRFGLDNSDTVRAVNLQPAAKFGRLPGDTRRLLVDEVIRLLAAQLPFVREEDVLPVPCCSPLCQAGLLLLRTPTGPLPLTRLVTPEVYRRVAGALSEADFLELVANTPDGKRSAERIAGACCLPLGPSAGALLSCIFPITITSFMDAETADLRRLGNCCIAVPAAGGLVPFCAYNLTDAAGNYAFRERLGWGGRTRSIRDSLSAVSAVMFAPGRGGVFGSRWDPPLVREAVR